MTFSNDFLATVRGPHCVTVTGPQRSGTRLATAILAHDLGRQFIGEEAYDVATHDGLLARYLAVANRGAEVVIHAPELSSIAHHLPGLIVFMHRDPADIARSQRRIDWAYEGHELIRYFTDQGPIGEVTYRAWDRYQKPLLGARAVDLDYASLAGHPLWVDASKRELFHPHQITVGNRSIEPIQHRPA